MSIHIFIDKDAVKAGHPAITVSLADCGTAIEQGAELRLTGAWAVRQYAEPRPCGASIVIEPVDESAEWETA